MKKLNISNVGVMVVCAFLVGFSQAEEDKQNEDKGPMATFRQFVPIIEKYLATGEEKTLNELKPYTFEVDNPSTGGKSLSVLRKEVGKNTWKNVEVLDKYWEEDGMALCLIVMVDPLSKFPSLRACLLFKEPESDKWLMVGSRSDAARCQSLKDRMEVVDRLYKHYEDAKREIRKPYFEKRERERATERAERGY